jgi:hypothetical protein
VVTPTEMFEHHSSDAVRYWAASARLGIDATFDEQQMRVGRRLAIKILNASRFGLTLEAAEGEIVDPLDRSMLRRLADVVDEATRALEEYEHAKALDVVERFFWGFTDDYLELVKSRAYGTYGAEAAASAIASLRLALSVLLRLFAPFLPYATEEVWSWWRQGSIHRAPWPKAAELTEAAPTADPLVYEVGSWVLGEVRKAKALAKRSLRVEVERVTVRDAPERLAALGVVERDVREAGNVRRSSPRSTSPRSRSPFPAGESAVRFFAGGRRLDARAPEHMPKPDLDGSGPRRPARLAARTDDHVTGRTRRRRRLDVALAAALHTASRQGCSRRRTCRRSPNGSSSRGEPMAGRVRAEYEHLLPYLEDRRRRTAASTLLRAPPRLAYLWFADKPVRLGVFEVGMGGTWDATNLVAGDVAVICPIGLDHPELGATVAEVAAEKAEIVKASKTVVVRDQEPDALAIVKARALEVGTQVLLEHQK